MPLQKASARMAESVDALVSNTCRFTPVPVRPRLRVLKEEDESLPLFLWLWVWRPFVLGAEVVQSVAVWQSCLWSAIIAIAIFCL